MATFAAPESGRAATRGAPRALVAFRRALLHWYEEHRRDLPWRKSCDPYRVWLSEIMLQQTRVAAVLEHYRVFLEHFPDVKALAEAPLENVLAAWSGLGYYRRARMLHQCAKEVFEKHGGVFPRTSAALRELPGIGRYTAAAIASICFEESAAVVDGNVERVVQRLVGKETAQPEIWRQAQLLLDPKRPGDFNQAMMELGATVCLPRDPKCAICPVRKWCAGKLEQGFLSRAKSLPRRVKREVKKEIWCTLDQRDGHIRLVRRPAQSSLMAGMWELPQQDQKPRRDAETWRTFRHSITATNYVVHVLRSRARAKGEWVALDEVGSLPLTGLTRKILRSGGII